MAQTAAWLVDCVIPEVPVRQWVLSFPIPLRSLFAVHPELLTLVLQIIHRVIATHLIKQAGFKRSDAATGAVTLIQRFGSAANINIHLHGLVLDGVYCTSAEGVPVFHPAPALTNEKLQALLDKIITRILRLLTREGHLVEEEGRTHCAVAAGIHATSGNRAGTAGTGSSLPFPILDIQSTCWNPPARRWSAS